ncbi:hypothetical protein CEXT_38681, partial [Caerostris extrusa]
TPLILRQYTTCLKRRQWETSAMHSLTTTFPWRHDPVRKPKRALRERV